MTYLNRINFDYDDGVNLAMMNDFMRNQFYDRILSRYAQGQQCTDIGFGTGFLSIMALKYGATHVRAFESDRFRYQLGCEIIQRLQLQDKIELIQDRYHRDTHGITPVTFTETVNGNLWGEGLLNSLPTKSGEIFLPGSYFLEIWAVEIPTAFAQGLYRTEKRNDQTIHSPAANFFTPGVDVDQTFVDLINEFRKTPARPIIDPLPDGIVNFVRQRETDWGWIPYMRAVQAGTVVASYCVDQRPVDQQIILRVPTDHWHDSIVLLVPRVGMQQDYDRLYLDTGAWGPAEDPIMLVKPQDTLQINHNLISGKLSYSMET